MPISKQIAFICALYNYPLPESNEPSFWKTMKKNFRLQAVGNDSKSKPAEITTTTEPLPRSMSTLEKRYIQDCVNTLYIRVKTIKSCRFIPTGQDNPHAEVLETASRIFIGCFNSYLSNLEGLYVENYGVVNARELQFQTVQVLSEILQETVDLEFLPRKVQAVAKNYLSIKASATVIPDSTVSNGGEPSRSSSTT